MEFYIRFVLCAGGGGIYIYIYFFYAVIKRKGVMGELAMSEGGMDKYNHNSIDA